MSQSQAITMVVAAGEGRESQAHVLLSGNCMNRSLPLFFSWMFTVCATALAVACGIGEAPPKGSPDAGEGSDATSRDGNDGGTTDSGGPAFDAGGAVDVGPLPDAGTVSVVREGGTPISPSAFGQNYWDWVDWSKNGITGLTGTEPLVTALHLNVLRAGGDENDSNSPQPFSPAEIDKFVAYCRMVGAEPILQVPIIANDADGGATTPQTAADMVTYANVTKSYGIRYWEIGNEPDLYGMSYDSGVP
ncbi:MAG: hypothetical protein M3O46_19315, partial [Myxococcota bacterium]|nr:hypothetical protein [Myxococcota bacterium]